MLKIQSLSVSYGSRHIVHDMSLDVQNGEVLALIGPNGAGKSTLIRAASGVIPYTGHVRTNGDDFISLSPHATGKIYRHCSPGSFVTTSLYCLGNCFTGAHTLSWIFRSTLAKG